MKKNPKAVLFSLLVLSLITVLVYSCKKEELDTESQSSVDNSIAEGEFSRIFVETNGIAVGDSGVQFQKGIYLPLPSDSCPKHWWDPTDTADGYPVTVWFEYGGDTTGDGVFDYACNTPGEKSRKGIIKAVFDTNWTMSGATVTMDLMDYYVDEIKYEGRLTITRNSSTSFTATVTNGKCTSGSWTILWNCSRTLNINLGDPNVLGDDVSTISGTASGTDRNGETFSVNITTPLRREMACRWVTSGVMTLKLDGKKDRTIDFGNGTCDNDATLTIDGNTFEFDLE